MPLRRALGLRTIVSTSAGLAFAAIEYLAIAGLIVYVAGDSAWIAILVAGALMLGVWGFYSELNGMFPTAAAIRLQSPLFAPTSRMKRGSNPLAATSSRKQGIWPIGLRVDTNRWGNLLI